MALKITTREEEGVTMLELEGRIVLGEETSALRAKVKSLLAEGKKVIVLSLLNVTFIDSTGLGTLVASQSSATAAGASLRLCDLGPRLAEMLQVTKLFTVFDVYDSEIEAFRALSKKASGS